MYLVNLLSSLSHSLCVSLAVMTKNLTQVEALSQRLVFFPYPLHVVGL